MKHTCFDCGYYEGEKEFKVGMEFTCNKIGKNIQVELIEDILECEEKSVLVEPYLKNDGYYYVELKKDGVIVSKRVDMLVAEQFLDKPKQGQELIHIDGDKTNNNHDNLKWV